jgi:hypothetical protein
LNTNRLTALLIAAFVIVVAASSLEAREYTVVPNDTLSKIAKVQLGSARRWKEIAELNGMRSPYSLKIGQKLILPDDGVDSRQPDDADADAGMEALNAQLQADASGSVVSVPEHLWLWGIAALLLFWMFCALCLRWGCWFSLVEATFGRCMFLALVYALLQILLVAVAALLYFWAFGTGASPIVGFVSMFFLIIINFVLAAIFTKRILDCKWRSVLTVTVMANLVANLIVSVIMMILGMGFGVLGADLIKDILGIS